MNKIIPPPLSWALISVGNFLDALNDPLHGGKNKTKEAWIIWKQKKWRIILDEKQS